MGTRKRPRAPEACPVCGEELRPDWLACPECGADQQSGWRVAAETYDAVDLPAADFDYDEFVEQEFGSSAKPAAIKRVWWVTAMLVLAALLAIYLYSARG